MQGDLAQRVHSVFQHGIGLKSRLVQGERLVLAQEQAVLRRLLSSDAETQRWPDFVGDGSPTENAMSSFGMGSSTNINTSPFLGIRYALACWLDEIFLIDSPWDSQWNENKLEMALYGTNDRAWRFWEQAQLAEKRQGPNALQSFFLSVMLGFRGDLRESPEQLQAWVDSCRKRLLQAPPSWTRPPELEPPTYVPPLRGRESLQRMVVSSGTLLLAIIPLIAFFLVFFFQQPNLSIKLPGDLKGPSDPGFVTDLNYPTDE